jgi:hypothetical protein
MNERIQALAEQAEKYASEKDGKYDGAGNLNWQWQDIKMEKFAELIVRECAGIVKFTPTGVPHATIIKIIKEHFGVEE